MVKMESWYGRSTAAYRRCLPTLLPWQQNGITISLFSELEAGEWFPSRMHPRWNGNKFYPCCNKIVKAHRMFEWPQVMRLVRGNRFFLAWCFICIRLLYLYSITLFVFDYFICIRLLYLYSITLYVFDYFICIRLLYLYSITLFVFDYFFCIRLLFLYSITFCVFDYFIFIRLLYLYSITFQIIKRQVPRSSDDDVGPSSADVRPRGFRPPYQSRRRPSSYGRYRPQSSPDYDDDWNRKSYDVPDESRDVSEENRPYSNRRRPYPVDNYEAPPELDGDAGEYRYRDGDGPDSDQTQTRYEHRKSSSRAFDEPSSSRGERISIHCEWSLQSISNLFILSNSILHELTIVGWVSNKNFGMGTFIRYAR